MKTRSDSGFLVGTRVEIGGRTMLSADFSLVGLSGLVAPRAANAPAGCVTVAVEWVGFGYTPENGYPEGSLPPCVNVPSAHVLVLEEAIGAEFLQEAEENDKEAEKPAPRRAQMQKNAKKVDDETKKPGLRLV